jgi:UrcA family protein
LAKPKSEAGAKLPSNLTEVIIMNSNIKTRIRHARAAAMLLTSVWGASSAFAGEPVRSETVKFHDLNVATPEGVQMLYGRIHAAANRVCFDSDPVLRQAASACARKAEANAIDKLNLSQLTAYYKIKTKTGDHMQPLVAAR